MRFAIVGNVRKVGDGFTGSVQRIVDGAHEAGLAVRGKKRIRAVNFSNGEGEGSAPVLGSRIAFEAGPGTPGSPRWVVKPSA